VNPGGGGGGGGGRLGLITQNMDGTVLN